MPDSNLLINTMQIEQSKLEEFRESVKNSLVFVEKAWAERHIDEIIELLPRSESGRSGITL
jgi:hypothetical protein